MHIDDCVFKSEFKTDKGNFDIKIEIEEDIIMQDSQGTTAPGILIRISLDKNAVKNDALKSWRECIIIYYHSNDYSIKITGLESMNGLLACIASCIGVEALRIFIACLLKTNKDSSGLDTSDKNEKIIKCMKKQLALAPFSTGQCIMDCLNNYGG